MTAQKQQYDVTISLEFERMYKYLDDDIFASTDPKVCTGSHGKPQG